MRIGINEGKVVHSVRFTRWKVKAYLNRGRIFSVLCGIQKPPTTVRLSGMTVDPNITFDSANQVWIRYWPVTVASSWRNPDLRNRLKTDTKQALQESGLPITDHFRYVVDEHRKRAKIELPLRLQDGENASTFSEPERNTKDPHSLPLVEANNIWEEQWPRIVAKSIREDPFRQRLTTVLLKVIEEYGLPYRPEIDYAVDENITKATTFLPFPPEPDNWSAGHLTLHQNSPVYSDTSCCI